MEKVVTLTSRLADRPKALLILTSLLTCLEELSLPTGYYWCDSTPATLLRPTLARFRDSRRTPKETGIADSAPTLSQPLHYNIPEQIRIVMSTVRITDRSPMPLVVLNS